MTAPGAGRSRSGLGRSFIGVYLALSLLLCAVFAIHYYAEYRAERTRREISESVHVELARAALASDIAAVVTDLMFLARHLESLSFDPVAAQARRRYLAEVFSTFAQEKGLYDQVRFIDRYGREVVRINYAEGRPELVQGEALQDKSARYYVPLALALPVGQAYVSPLDLNVEDGTIERPYKPVMRFATPVFDRAGTRQGIVVLNYLGDRLLEHFRRAAVQIVDHVQLLNEAGHWLSSPVPGQAWGFMFGRSDTFARRHPEAWRTMGTQPRGQFTAVDTLFTYATVRPAAEAARSLVPGQIPAELGETWRIVSQIPLAAVAPAPRAFVARHAGLYAGLFALLGLFAFLLASAQWHRRAAEAQRAYERRFRQTLEDIGLAALMVDRRGRVTFCNRYLLELTGWQHGEVVGSDWVSHFVARDEQATVKAVLARLEKSGDFPPEFEGEVQTRAGEHRRIAWNNTLTRDAEGRVLGLTAIGEDVTERRRAEEQVRKLSQAVEQSPSIVMITDPAGRIEYVNPKFTEVTGYSGEEVAGRNPRLLKSGETSDERYAGLWQTITRGEEWRGEFHNRRKDGSLYWEAAAISALRGPGGEITHYLAVKSDITERKRLEREIEESGRALARNQTLAELGRMAAMLAHDLRNPLSSVKMAVQILGKRAADPESRELAGISQEQVRYMEDIITDMLTFARPGELKLEWLHARKLLEGAVATARRRIQEAAAKVEVACVPGLPTFPGDASKLRQLLVNLLVNALQATMVRPADERRVTMAADVRFEADGTRIRIRVCDNGEGIDPDQAAQLFEPFVTTRARGTGLGLAIVRQIAERHGGQVDLAPNPLGGTCAELLLPVVPADAGDRGVSDREAATPAAAGAQ